MEKLREEIKEKFIDTGVDQEFILGQEIADPHGNFSGAPIIGLPGGIIAQMCIVLSALKEQEVQNPDSGNFWKKRQLLTWMVTYLGQAIKQETITVLFGQHLMSFLEKNDIELDDVPKGKIRGQVGEQFRAIIKDRTEGMVNEYMRIFCRKSKEMGLDQEICNLVHDILLDLVVKKMKTSNSLFSKLEAFLEKLSLSSVPEGFSPDQYKALVRIRIPMVEDKEEEEEKSDAKSDKEAEGEEEEEKELKPIDPSKLKEARLEDKVLMVNPNHAESGD